jgi:hypothetical protein
MKKFVTFLFFSALLNVLFAQTFVSTEPMQQNAILEEFTGVNCQYCPDGHRIANELMQAHPDRFWAINVHAGGYAPTSNPNYHSADGDLIHGYFQSQITGYPCGTIDRNGITDRGQWASLIDTALSKQSYVNVAAQGTLDFTARLLTITVEAYYTASAPTSENYLTVAMLQDNIMGSQVGGSTWNPSQVINGKYRHMHMLRDIITPTWGDPITQTSSGSFFTQTYTYEIPEIIGTPDVILQDLSFLVWISEEEHTKIITANKVELNYINIPFIAPMVYIATERNITTCDPETGATLQIRSGSDVIHSLEISYNVANGTPMFFTWQGDREIPPLEYDTINMPAFTVTPNVNQKVSVEITKVNDIPVTTTAGTVTVKKNIADAEGKFALTFELKTDRWGSETTWQFIGPDGIIIIEDGPYDDLSTNTTTTYTYALDPWEYGCYRLEVYDSYGDGINSGSGSGSFRVYQTETGKNILSDNGKFGSRATYMIVLDEFVSITPLQDHEALIITPNPVIDNIIIDVDLSIKIQQVDVFNLIGQHIITQKGDVRNISVSELSKGLYFLRVVSDKGVTTHKFVKQ